MVKAGYTLGVSNFPGVDFVLLPNLYGVKLIVFLNILKSFSVVQNTSLPSFFLRFFFNVNHF